ncbi:adenylate/guanylate cyclase domain-containing protein [Thermophagus sp. OGC60D27]|uniref:adenylate/guanylate cyclase domain-containing protein n=1 Tax=Thermophagus sp. OGC60D27 TaxID=3458415 RepID=UPI0040381B98
MNNLERHIQQIQKLARRNQALNSQLKNLTSQYSAIQQQAEKYNQLLSRFSEWGVAEWPEKPSKKKVEHLKMVSLLYVSICGFEALTQMDNQSHHIDILDEIYISINKIAQEFNLTKIKSFGDNMIYAVGLSNKNRTNPIDITMAAIRMNLAIQNIYNQQRCEPVWKVKMGIHTGPILATDKSRRYSPFSISGDNINVVCRLGESCPPAKINMSEMTCELVKEFFQLSSLGTIPVRFKGSLKMFLVNGLNEELQKENNPFEGNKTFAVRYGHIQFLDIQEKVLDLLEKNLPSNLYYHDVKHTIDVITEVELIGWAEGLSEEEILTLKTAALFHDAGHMVDYRTHEYQGILLARQILTDYQYPPERIETISRLIMATKSPPTPKDKLEEVICDSDLDYLGRTDFIPVSNNLYRELKERQMVGSWNDWLQLQLNFIQRHQYYTQTARNLREVNKQQQIERIQSLINKNKVRINY